MKPGPNCPHRSTIDIVSLVSSRGKTRLTPPVGPEQRGRFGKDREAGAVVIPGDAYKPETAMPVLA